MATKEQAEEFLKENGWIKQKGHWLDTEDFRDEELPDKIFYADGGAYDVLTEGYAYVDCDDGADQAYENIEDVLDLFDADWEIYCKKHKLTTNVEKGGAEKG